MLWSTSASGSACSGFAAGIVVQPFEGRYGTSVISFSHAVLAAIVLRCKNGIRSAITFRGVGG